MPLSPEALNAFIADLRGSGYVIDPGQLTAVQHLALLSGSGAWPGADARLGHILAPVLARTPTEQSDIMRRFEAWRPLLYQSDHARLSSLRPPALPPLRAPTLEAIPDTAAGTTDRLTLLRQRWFALGSVAALAGILTLVGTAVVHELRPVSVPPGQPIPPASAGPASPPSTGQSPFRPLAGPSHVSTPQSTTVVSGVAVAPPWSAALPVVLSSLPVAIAIVLWLSKRRHRQRLRRLAVATPRDLAEMQILVPDTPLFEGVTSELAARDFARPRRLLSEKLDIDRTVDATARAAGATQLVFETRSLTPSYVIMVEEAGRHDHLARLGDILVSRLSDAGVHAESYHILHSELVRDRNDRILNLDEVADRHHDYRLLMLGPGENVLDRTNQLVRALREDAPWADRSYLVLGRIDALTAKRLTDDGFVLAPASPVGMRALGQHIASAPRERGEMLMPVPGMARRLTRRVGLGRAVLHTTVPSPHISLDQVRTRLVATLRVPLVQLPAVFAQRAIALGNLLQGTPRKDFILFDRVLLRKFLLSLGESSQSHRVLVVNGPPGSGKTFTISIAQWLVGHKTRVIVVRLDSFLKAHDVAQNLYCFFGWHWEPSVENSEKLAQIATRYAQRISARAEQDETKSLIIFHNDSLTLAPDVRDFVGHLAMEATGLSFIIIGLDKSVFLPSVMTDFLLEELKNFSDEEIAIGLREVLERLNISTDNVSIHLEIILSSVEPGDEYNKRVSSAAHRVLEGLSDRAQA